LKLIKEGVPTPPWGTGVRVKGALRLIKSRNNTVMRYYRETRKGWGDQKFIPLRDPSNSDIQTGVGL